MSTTKPSKPSKSTTPTSTPTQPPSSTKAPPPSSSSLSSHLAMIELKNRILTALSKLSDRDTYQIAVSDLESIVLSLTPDSLPMLLNSLFDPTSASSDKPPAVKKESLRLLALLATSHPDATSSHLTKILAHIVRRLKDSDSAVRDACRDTIAALSSQYIKGDGEAVALFVKPLFEAMTEQSKAVQAGCAMCLARMVDCAREPPITAFQKLCPRICKYLNNQNFLAKAAVLSVVSSLSQVGAISPQSLPTLMPSIHGCLESSDWATRKAAADTLNVMASHLSHLISDGAASTITALEGCRFDKVKPVRDSMNEALQLWKKISGNGGDVVSDDSKAGSRDGKDSESTESAEKSGLKRSNTSERRLESSGKDPSSASSPNADSLSRVKGSSMSDKTVGILKKRAPALSDKELNPEFFQKLETRGSGDLPVEVVVPRRCLHSSHSQGEEESDLNDADSIDNLNNNGAPCGEGNDIHGPVNVNYHSTEKRAGVYNKMQDLDEYARDKWTEQRIFRGKDPKTRAFDGDDRIDINQRDLSGARAGFSRTDGHSEGSFMNNKGNWLAIQRQLAQLERQQANLMTMLQDFMGGSHDSMVTLENRVRGLERIVEDMARDLAISSGRRGSNLMMGFEGSSGRPLSKYNGLADYSSSKLGRGGDGRIPFAERFLSSDGIVSGVRGRDPPWRSDASDAWDSYAHGASRNGHVSSRRAPSDGRLPRTEHEGDQVGNRRVWDKGPGPRLGEGPSARSVWQASKDEATLEAIRVAGEDNGTSRTTARVTIPELNAEALTDDNSGQERGPLWASWTHAMDSLHVGDMDSAYAELLSTGDDQLLVKLMDRSGPVIDQLSSEIASEILHAIGQFLLEQSLLDIGLSWIQQLTDLVMENGPDFLGIPIEIKRELLLSLHDATVVDPPEDWEGATADQLMLQLASAWGINLQQLEK
ncbi:microtubule-associated protein TORTIFOLIA1-like [Magnolia sinica]|uniref:microtubule-associated protein TORTIFOLIA1-like n=1 Tax=Magnolia sinica TaxID=86752 RepID=UPI00265A5F4E|nr:microtubule-associated protein TORTIFOLIA1-like [Magnolia sinica]